jgi:hypothetical protein
MITIHDVRAAFGNKEVMTCQKLVAALKIEDAQPEDREEGQSIQDWLAYRLKTGFGIVEREVYNNGKRCKAYVKEDFEPTENGHVRGTATYLNQRQAIVEKGLGTRSVLDRLKQIAQGLKEDEPCVKERLRRLEAAIECEYRCTFNIGDR